MRKERDKKIKIVWRNRSRTGVKKNGRSEQHTEQRDILEQRERMEEQKGMRNKRDETGEKERLKERRKDRQKRGTEEMR